MAVKLPTSKWNENSEFQQAKDVVNAFQATNDFVERGVALMQNFK